MVVKKLETGALSYEFSEQNKPVRTFKPDRIFHLRGLTTDGIIGLSVLGAAKRAIEGTIATENYGSTLFKQGIRPSGVLETDANLSPEAAKQLKESLEAAYSGVDNAHKTLVLEDGLKWKPVSLSAEDTQFIESRKFARSEIAMFFGVPPHLIGDIDRGTSWGSGIEQQNRGFLTYTLRPYLTSICQAFARDLLPIQERANYTFQFDTYDLERADFGPRQVGLEIQRRNKVISRNEWRKWEGLNPIDDPEADNASEAPTSGAGATSVGGASNTPGSQGSSGGSAAGSGDQNAARGSAPLRLVP
jgi:HK97 family phage portal protein